MKKILFFALALVVGALAFTSCNPNDPSNPKSLVGTMWRVDSCLLAEPVEDMGPASRYYSSPYVIINVASEEGVYLDESETLTKYSFSKDNKTLYVEIGDRQIPFEVIELTADFAHIRGLGIGETEYPMDYYTDEDIYLSRILQAEGANKDFTVANVAGTWKLNYIDENGWYSGPGQNSSWHRIYSSSQYHDLEIFVFNNDGTMNHTYVLERDLGLSQESWYWETTWNITDGKICYGIDELPEEILTLTDKVMVTKSVRHDENKGYTNHVENVMYYSRLK